MVLTLLLLANENPYKSRSTTKLNCLAKFQVPRCSLTLNLNTLVYQRLVFWFLQVKTHKYQSYVSFMGNVNHIQVAGFNPFEK